MSRYDAPHKQWFVGSVEGTSECSKKALGKSFACSIAGSFPLVSSFGSSFSPASASSRSAAARPTNCSSLSPRSLPHSSHICLLWRIADHLRRCDPSPRSALPPFRRTRLPPTSIVRTTAAIRRTMRATLCLCLAVLCCIAAAASASPHDAAGAAAPGVENLPFTPPLRPDESRIATPFHPHSSLLHSHALPHHSSPALDTSDALQGVFGSLIKRDDTASFARWFERELVADRDWADRVERTPIWTVFAPTNEAVDEFLRQYDGVDERGVRALPPRNAIRSHFIPDQSIFLMGGESMPALMPLLTAAQDPQVTLYLCEYSSEVRCDEAITAQAHSAGDDSTDSAQQGSPNAPMDAERIQLLRSDLTQENRVAGNGVVHLISHVLAGPAERPQEDSSSEPAEQEDSKVSRADRKRAMKEEEQEAQATHQTPLPPPEVPKSAKIGLGHSLRSSSNESMSAADNDAAAESPANVAASDAAASSSLSHPTQAQPNTPSASTLLDPLQAELGAPLQQAPPGAPHPAASASKGEGKGLGPVPSEDSPFEPPSAREVEQAAKAEQDREKERRKHPKAKAGGRSSGGEITWRGVLFLSGVAVVVILLSIGLTGVLVRNSPRVDAAWNCIFGCCCRRRSAQEERDYDEIDGAHSQSLRDDRPLLSERGEAYQASTAGRKPPDL